MAEPGSFATKYNFSSSSDSMPLCRIFCDVKCRNAEGVRNSNKPHVFLASSFVSGCRHVYGHFFVLRSHFIFWNVTDNNTACFIGNAYVCFGSCVPNGSNFAAALFVPTTTTVQQFMPVSMVGWFVQSTALDDFGVVGQGSSYQHFSSSQQRADVASLAWCFSVASCSIIWDA